MTTAMHQSAFTTESTYQILLSTFSQEFMALLAFVISFFAWRRVCRKDQRREVKSVDKVTTRKLSGYCSPPKGAASTDVSSGTRVGSPLERKAAQAAGARDKAMTPSVQVAIKQMMRHLEQREFTRALHIFRSLERDGWDRCFTEELYASFIQSGIRVGKTDVVERMFMNMKRNGVKASLSLWQTTLKMQSSRKQFSSVLVLQSLYKDQAPCDAIVYSCFINAALEVGESERAVSLLQPYSKAGITLKDYVLHFRAYVANGDADNAEAVFRQLGAGTSPLMLNLLLLTCVNKKDAARAHALLREAHDLEDLTDPNSKRIVDAVSYNTVIKGYMGEEAPLRCFVCLQEMLAKNVEPDDVTLSTLFDACVVEKDLGVAMEVVNFMMDRDRHANTTMCTLFIKGLLRVGALPKAMELYQSMKQRSTSTSRPDIVTYSMLIKALVDRGDLEPALQLLEDMTVAGIVPDDIVLTHLVEGCRNANRFQLGKRLFEELIAAGVQPSEFTLMAMLKLCGRFGAHAEAVELVTTWKERHRQAAPSVIHYTCVMSGCLRSKKTDQAWSAFELMCSRNVSPDKTTLSTLLPGLVEAKQWERAIQLVKRVIQASADTPIDADALHGAIAKLQASISQSAESDAASAGLQLQLQELRLLMK